MIPFTGWTRIDTPDEPQLKALGEKMRSEIASIHGKIYSNIKGIDLYVTTRTAFNWWVLFYSTSLHTPPAMVNYGHWTIKLCRFYTADANTENSHRAAGMTIELRDTGSYGFELPPSQVGVHSIIRSLLDLIIFCGYLKFNVLAVKTASHAMSARQLSWETNSYALTRGLCSTSSCK